MAPQNVSALTSEQKVEQAIWRGVKLLPGDIGAELMSFLTTKSVAIMVGTLVGLAVAQAFGIGELADALLLIAGIGFCGWGAVDGCRDLFHFVKTAIGARSEQDLDMAAHYFASAVVKIGVTAIMAFLLKKPLKSFREAGGLKSFKTMNYKPSLEYVSPPPPPGTVPAIQYQAVADAIGETDAYGNIVIDSGLDADEAKITLNHELVHRFFSPKFGPFLRLRARVAISGYMRSAMLRYLEEAMAEGYAQVRAEGFTGVIKGIRFPISPRTEYISIDEQAGIRGQLLGVIIVNGQAMTVSLQRGLPPASQPATQQQSAQSPVHP